MRVTKNVRHLKRRMKETGAGRQLYFTLKKGKNCHRSETDEQINEVPEVYVLLLYSYKVGMSEWVSERAGSLVKTIGGCCSTTKVTEIQKWNGIGLSACVEEQHYQLVKNMGIRYPCFLKTSHCPRLNEEEQGRKRGRAWRPCLNLNISAFTLLSHCRPCLALVLIFI